MILFDLGNTRLKCARANADGQVFDVAGFDHRADGFDRELSRWLDAAGDAPQGLLASVLAGDAGAGVEAMLRTRQPRLHRIGLPRHVDGLQLAYAAPDTLGVDRWLAMLGALDAPSLVVSVGTALTLDLLADGHHIGGLIAAAPERMREALVARAPHLPASGGEVSDFATDTAGALASGARLAAVALIERQHAVATARLGAPPRLRLIGGGRADLRPWLRVPFEESDTLVFEGMLRWWRIEQAGGATPPRADASAGLSP